MMMLEQFTVENFKAFKSLELKDLGHINIFVGDNNVGKTCLLQALFIANNFGKNKILGEWESLRYIDSGSFLYPAFKGGDDLSSLFHKLDMNLTVRLLLSSNNNSGDPISINYNYPTEAKELLTQSIPKYLKKEEYPDFNSPFFHFAQGDFSSEVSSFVKNSPRFNSSNYSISSIAFGYFPSVFDTLENSFVIYERLKKNKNTKPVIKIIKESIEPRLENIEILGKDLYCDLGFSFDTLLPISVMGDGFIKLFSIALALTTSTNCVFLDEPENGFHYKTQTSFWKLLTNWSLEGDKQSFIATHSYELISCLNDLLTADPTLLKRGLKVRVHRLKRDEEDMEKIHVVTIAEEGIAALLEMNLELR